jgi:hypothetical protein
MARMVATKAALSIRLDALADADSKSSLDAATIGIDNRVKLESRLRQLEAGIGHTSLRSLARSSGGEQQKRYEPKGNGATYAAGADAVAALVPTGVEAGKGADEGVVKMAVDVEETEEEKKKREKKEKKERRKSEAAVGGEEDDEVCFLSFSPLFPHLSSSFPPSPADPPTILPAPPLAAFASTQPVLTIPPSPFPPSQAAKKAAKKLAKKLAKEAAGGDDTPKKEKKRSRDEDASPEKKEKKSKKSKKSDA